MFVSKVPVELSNVVEVAGSLDVLTSNVESITTHDLINVQKTLTNIVELEATLPQVMRKNITFVKTPYLQLKQ